METRALIALALSFAIFMVFMYVGEKQRQKSVMESPPSQVAEAEKPVAVKPEPPVSRAPSPPMAVHPKPAAPSQRPSKDVVVDTPLYRAVFTENGALLKSFRLKKYRESMPFETIYAWSLGPIGLEIERYQDPDKVGIKPKELVKPGRSQELPLGLSWEGENLSLSPPIFYEADRHEVSLQGEATAAVQFKAVTPEGFVVTKTFKFRGDSYGFELVVKVANQGPHTMEGHLDLALTANFAGVNPGAAGFLGFNGSINQRLDDVKVGKLKELKTFTGKIDWAGLDEGYFLMAAVPQSAPKCILTLKESPPEFMTATLRNPETLVPGQEVQHSYILYFGPKELRALQALNIGLERVVNFGWFDFFAKPMLYVLNFIDRYVHNYGWSLIIFTLLTRLVLFYPNHRAYKSMKEMQKLQPKVAKIREKYKDDREAMNKELMALYRTFKVNPLGGCLPMALQLPIFIALYNVLSYAIELRHTPFIPTLPFTDIVWLADLSAKDPLLITPLVMGATMVIQQKMTPSPGDPAQAKMMMFLPIVFTFLFLNFASGLVIYWLINNVLSIIQQAFTNKYLA